MLNTVYNIQMYLYTQKIIAFLIDQLQMQCKVIECNMEVAMETEMELFCGLYNK